MKWIYSQTLMFLLAVGLMVFSGCSEDEPLGTSNPIPQGPSIQLVSDAGFIAGDAEINLGELVNIKVSALPGDEDLKSIEIFEGSEKLATDRFVVEGGAITSNNPFLITGSKTSGGEYEIEITPVDVPLETRTYIVEVTDGANLTAAVSFSITVTGTPVSEITGVLLNQGGPAGQGALNLNDGSSTGTSSSDPTSATAHIKDEGINTDLALADNWRQQISAINGSVIRTPGATMPEGFSYENITTREALVAAFDVADDLTQKNANDELVSEVVQVGDIFLVQNGDDYWILETTAVNITDADNSDNYEFSIKK